MLAIFHKTFAHPPQELNSPTAGGLRVPQNPEEILKAFHATHPDQSFSANFSGGAALACTTSIRHVTVHRRYRLSSTLVAGDAASFFVVLLYLSGGMWIGTRAGRPKGFPLEHETRRSGPNFSDLVRQWSPANRSAVMGGISTVDLGFFFLK